MGGVNVGRGKFSLQKNGDEKKVKKIPHKRGKLITDCCIGNLSGNVRGPGRIPWI